MSDMRSETLQQLVLRRLEQMGFERGRDEPLSLREAFLSVADPEISYEIVRRVAKGLHTNIGDGAVHTIASMINVSENKVRLAAGQKLDLGEFQLPPRANGLNRNERAVVLSVIDAILGSAGGERPANPNLPPDPFDEDDDASVTNLSDRRPTVDDLRGLPSAAEPVRRDQGGEGGQAGDGNDT